MSLATLWMVDQLAPGGAAYNVWVCVRLQGAVDPRALERTLAAIVARHESLRTVFEANGGEPRQRIEPYRGLMLPVVDLSSLPAGELRRESDRLERESACRPFDLSCGPLLRVLLLLQGPERSELVVVMHHIISDGWSMKRKTTPCTVCFPNGTITRCPGPISPASDSGRA